ncbi:MAG TPA: putative baseplate assembly protein, partial [Pyrinomonadaceae bacterium]|nr:putative baseplate assembly protein [Pyrinomonadaceae bacterium]
PPHHSAAIVWEVQTRPGLWREVEAQDHTRSLTLSGLVMLTLPGAAAVARAGIGTRPLAYVRARLASGSFDAAPLARRVLANAVEAEQCAPVHEEWTIAVGVVAVGTPPLPGGGAWLYCDFDNQGKVTSLEFTSEADDALPVRMLAYQPATNAQEGRLTLEARRVGTGTGAPNQHYGVGGPQLSEQGFELYTLESGNLRKWRRRESLLASGWADADYVLDAASASVQFGDGERGRVPPAGATVIAVALETAGASGNAAADTINALNTGAHNVALIGRGDAAKLKAVAARFSRITNPAAASGGAEAETLAHAEGRAVQTLTRPSRAVTLEDCEALALATPGTNLARAAALANQHPGFQCYAAPGFITLVIVPHLPAGRPTPSAGLLAAVSSYLNRRHVIGTRIEVTGPEYLEVEVHAHVKVFQGQSKTAAREAVTEALRKFFDPLAGGPGREGWPLGRDVYVSEVVEVIAAVPGVDHVLSLELQVPGCEPQCGNVCLRPLALTVSGTHQIQVS